MDKNKLYIIAGGLAFLGLAYWLFQGANKPLPGESLADLGRDHINDIAEIKYNSNPPTSGSHFPVWAKAGVYDRVISDGYLIHSLEHGYINISYNCDYKAQGFGLVNSVLAHEEEIISTESGEATTSAIPLVHMQKPSGNISWWSSENPPKAEIGLPTSFESDDCKKLVEQLKILAQEEERTILVPRPSLDGSVALTAWTKILKFTSPVQSGLSQDEINIAKEFIKAYHNKGPEKTME